MGNRFKFIFFLLLCILSSCNVKKKNGDENLAKELYLSVKAAAGFGEFNKLNETLEAGADPNYCIGRYGWSDSNPLGVVVAHIYDSYWKIVFKGKRLPDSFPDVETIKILVKAGADINKRPYVWQRVHSWDNSSINDIQLECKEDNIPVQVMKTQIKMYIADANRVLVGLIEAGADPDMKGHSILYSPEGISISLNDEEAMQYAEKGSRPINEAIKKGIMWESQVDLLLQYVKLDEESLEGAKESNDLGMLEKIEKLWAEQQSEKK